MEVNRRWPAFFAGRPPHYLCESCGFVHEDEKFFHIDHVVPRSRDGTNDLIRSDLRTLIDAGDIAALHVAGVNSMVLCSDCNQRKSASAFVPKNAGLARRFTHLDRNPDHLYGNRPS